jgi:hypothetical protein
MENDQHRKRDALNAEGGVSGLELPPTRVSFDQRA